MDINKLTDLKIKIEKLTFENQKKILKLFLDNNINISENNNGTFILMNNLTPDMYEKLTIDIHLKCLKVGKITGRLLNEGSECNS